MPLGAFIAYVDIHVLCKVTKMSEKYCTRWHSATISNWETSQTAQKKRFKYRPTASIDEKCPAVASLKTKIN